MSRAKGSCKPCDVQQARQRLVDARQFLEAAELLDAPDVVATCAIHAAIAAADAITCHALGERSRDGRPVGCAQRGGRAPTGGRHDARARLGLGRGECSDTTTSRPTTTQTDDDDTSSNQLEHLGYQVQLTPAA